MGWLYSPHQIFAAFSSLETINLSLGERPVCEPVVAAKAPFEANSPSPRARACSTSSGGERFQLILPKFTSPYSSRALRLIIIVINISPLRLIFESRHRKPGEVDYSTMYNAYNLQRTGQGAPRIHAGEEWLLLMDGLLGSGAACRSPVW